MNILHVVSVRSGIHGPRAAVPSRPGLTEGVEAFAHRLRAAGHDVDVPDLYEGRTFATIDEGLAHARERGFQAITAAGVEIAEDLPSPLVYAGFSMGAMPAQRLAQQRAGARGSLLYHAAAPLTEFGQAWPDGVPLQMHVMVDDPFDDLPVMQELVTSAGGELFTYEGSAHLFTDSSLDDHDPQAARLVLDRTLEFLARLE